MGGEKRDRYDLLLESRLRGENKNKVFLGRSSNLIRVGVRHGHRRVIINFPDASKRTALVKHRRSEKLTE